MARVQVIQSVCSDRARDLLQGTSGDVGRAAGHHEVAEGEPGGGLPRLHGGQLQAALSSQWPHCQGQELLSSSLQAHLDIFILNLNICYNSGFNVYFLLLLKTHLQHILHAACRGTITINVFDKN